MENNLFLKNINSEYRDSLVNVRANHAFIRELISQIGQVYHVEMTEKRFNDTTINVKINEHRYTRFTPAILEANEIGVTMFLHVSYSSLGRVLGEEIDYHKIKDSHFKKPTNDRGYSEAYEIAKSKTEKQLQDIASKHGFKLELNRDSSCGDWFTLKTTISKSDINLDSKIKTLMRAFNANNVKFRLDAI